MFPFRCSFLVFVKVSARHGERGERGEPGELGDDMAFSTLACRLCSSGESCSSLMTLPQPTLGPGLDVFAVAHCLLAEPAEEGLFLDALGDGAG